MVDDKVIKEGLVSIARPSERRPARDTLVGRRLAAFVDPSHPDHDPEFTGVLRATCPSWVPPFRRGHKVAA